MDAIPSIYVGTYGQYNNGSLFGKWFDLTDYADKSDFIDAITEYHKAEYDPEFMFQDYEGIPEQFVSECSIDSAFWDYMDAVSSSHLDDDVFSAGMCLGIPYEEIEDKYQGHHNSKTDLAYEYIESTGMLSDVSDSISNYFDYDSFGRDLAMDYSEFDGHYFLC